MIVLSMLIAFTTLNDSADLIWSYTPEHEYYTDLIPNQVVTVIHPICALERRQLCFPAYTLRDIMWFAAVVKPWTFSSFFHWIRLRQRASASCCQSSRHLLL